MKVYKTSPNHAANNSPRSPNTKLSAYTGNSPPCSSHTLRACKKRTPASSIVDLSRVANTSEATPCASVPSVCVDEKQTPIRKDPLFYDEPLILLVEKTLFKVPRGYFEKYSTTFRTRFLDLPNGQDTPDGLTNERPLRLEGVDTAEFRCLLNALIREGLAEDMDMSWMQWNSVLKLSLMWKMKPIQSLALQKISSGITSTDQWIAALKLSTDLKMQELREMAILKLHPTLCPFRMVELGSEFAVAEWLKEAYMAFATRSEGLSEEDEEKLGWKRASQVYRVRHRRIEAQNTRAVAADIQATFKDEFALDARVEKPILYLQPNLRTVTDPMAMQFDKEYYFVDIIFLVENTLFKVPRYLFEQSSDVFRHMFLLPVTDGLMPDGFTDEQPLRLEGILQADFRLLLKAMKFPPSASAQTQLPTRDAKSKSQRPPDKGTYNAPMLWNDWASVLELSCMWLMPKIREVAIQKILEYGNSDKAVDWRSLLRLATKLQIVKIRERAIKNLLDTLQPVDMIDVGTDCGVKPLLLQGFTQLVETQGGISEKDEERLGCKTTSRLFRIREKYLQSKYRMIPWLRTDYVTNEIEKIFAEELKDAG